MRPAAARPARGAFVRRRRGRRGDSFAGQHLTLLNVPSSAQLADALREVWWSANSDSAITYRKRTGVFTRPSIGVVVQALLDPEVAGVMFTTNPVNGADERVIESAWGLGEAVVAGLVIPDHYRVARSGEVLERTAGLKKIAIRTLRDGGTVEEELPRELVETPPSTTSCGCPEPPSESLRAGLRRSAGHRMGDRRRGAVPAPVPGRDPGRVLSELCPVLQSRSCGASRSSPT